MTKASAVDQEAARQQWLLRALWRDPGSADESWLGDAAARRQRGLQAYRINAAASAERALTIAFPVVATLIGEASFAALARDLWRQHPPERGDLGEWGGALPDFIAASGTLASEPYLADSARLDWQVHLASRAAEGPDALPALDALGEHPPEALRLVLRPGCASIASGWPIVAIWQAHQRQADEDGTRFDGVRAAFAGGRADHAFVWRDGWAVRVEAQDGAAAAFIRAVTAGTSLAAALDAAGEAFAFDRWLQQAVQQRWLVAVQPLAAMPLP